ncbi:imelysin family protein [Cellulophaga baltica]|uniref:imelysin family protein n=1 Tax=Cellulophaga TaxID=104264 RepID=UPI001C065441|nr:MULTISPECIES: imelysin family protein [Cellulophaga]MBU2996805.1 imelysin family protein [Cellulophaga baltica]MDO6768201.1 imelysin family protein [Cellulophaga sp. 1_MG-2023]
MKKYLLSSFCILLFTFSCKNDDTTTTAEPLDDFYENFYTANIYPAIIDFQTNISTEIDYINQFNENQTAENLTLLQDQWLISAQSYSKLRAYNYVPVKQNFYDTNIYNFPVNTAIIETLIEEEATYDTSYISVKSTTSKGLGAMEFLLFNEHDTTEALALLQDNEFRVNYLLGVAYEVLRQTELLLDFWENDYKTEFANSDGDACTSNARCLAFNQLINILDVIKVTKIGKPAGLESSDNIDLEILEAFRSKTSLELIKSSIEEVEYIYSLSDVNFASIVDEIDDTQELSGLIASSFEDVYTSIDAIDTSLYDAITANPEKVETLYNALGDLTVYFSVDGASLLSVTVLPTDNDGD